MLKTLLIGGCVAFAAFSAGGAKAYIDSKAGDGTTSAAIHYGTHSAAQASAEIPTAANEVIAENKTPIGNLIHQGTGAISSATGGSWDQPVDPSQQTPTTVAP